MCPSSFTSTLKYVPSPASSGPSRAPSLPVLPLTCASAKFCALVIPFTRLPLRLK